MVLKHDIHDLDLQRLVEFASEEVAQGIVGSYYFMAPGHPLTARSYSPAEQIEAMLRIHALGHEVGLHVDPLFLIDWKKRPLRELMDEMVAQFRSHGLEIVSGNMHGNSQFKGLDRNGYGTSFDLFEEIARQPDYPELRDVDPAVADDIRRHRMRLSEIGLTHWADMPLYSRRFGYVVTQFVTDNQLAKKGSFEVRIDPEAVGQYKLADRQPPGSRSRSVARETIALAKSPPAPHLAAGSHHLALDDEALEDAFVALSAHPTLILIHPQHYL